jgi:hypothetical protein
VKLPAFRPDTAIGLARIFGIPIAPTERSTGAAAVEISNLSTHKVVSTPTNVVGSVAKSSGLKGWTLEIGAGASPTSWKRIGSGDNEVTDAVLGSIDPKDYEPGVYTVRLSVDDGRGLSDSVVINIDRKVGPSGSATPKASPSPGANVTPQLPVLNTPVPTHSTENSQAGGNDTGDNGTGRSNGNGRDN